MMALFKVNTGCRENEVCQLRWEWEVVIPELKTSVFLIPGHLVKNKEDRLVVVNKIASSIIEKVHGQHPEYVFTYKGKPMSRINNSAWARARVKAELKDVRVHDLKHTFGRRLRAAGVSFEDRQDLLGHRSARITTHYSSAEIRSLIESANSICKSEELSFCATLLKRGNDKIINAEARFRRNPTNEFSAEDSEEKALG
jgi:integrase